MAFSEARGIIESALAARAFPAAVVEVGRRAGPVWQEPFGTLTYDPGAPRTTLDTHFDLASLTKVIVTASIAMRDVADGRLSLDWPLARVFSAWRGREADGIHIRHLLDHSSGLPAHIRLWERAAGRAEYLREILATPLEEQPGTHAVYSDLGFILLGFVLEELGGETLDRRFGSAMDEIVRRSTRFGTAREAPSPVAPTEIDAWRGRLLVGEVHDENAAALGGVAGHAGLFGPVADVGAFARLVLETFRAPTALGTPALMRTFASRSAVPGSSRALGWDTMLPTSSCGTLMSSTAIGHTGFTGTSLWIDWERDLYVALLTNRVHPTRDNAALVELRPRIHDAIVKAL